jgi:large subunit ribosomal protein L30
MSTKKVSDQKVKVTLVRSLCGRDKNCKAIATSLGLNKIGKSKIYPVNPCIAGMVRKLSHLVKIESA